MRRLLALLLWRGLAALVGSTAAHAQTPIDRLVSPGPLNRAHAAAEVRCVNCHTPFQPKAENGNCLACHHDVATDLTRSTGFHGRSPPIKSEPCRQCHTDHRGRTARIIEFEPDRFNHDFTDFRLTGAHVKTRCADCHVAAHKFREAPVTCIACHRKNDVHLGRLGTSCASCHVTAGWRSTKPFDHGATSFALLGQHATTRCAGCHVDQRWHGTPQTCIGCHAANDVHKGDLGTQCQTCHTPRAWRTVRFDHNVQTRFPLVGKHQPLPCAACHGVHREVPRPPLTCVGCHRADDVHKGRNGDACASCHTPVSWTTILFDHDRQTRFVLTGAHRTTACAACHTAAVTSFKPPLTCIGCHSSRDVHRGRLGTQCGNCHTTTWWARDVRFDHGLTRFPLFDSHARLACTACHRDKSFVAAGVECAACHLDRHHVGRLGAKPQCSTCHRPTTWSAWRFNHDQQTHFVLSGRHAVVACAACHNKPAETAMLPSACFACHRADDVHQGSFGRDCAACHASDSFRNFHVARKPEDHR